MSRFLAFGTLLACLTAPVAARAADKPEGPSLMLRLQSIDHLLENAEYVMALAGQEEQGKQVLGFVKLLKGEKGIEGVDTKRPFILYATLAEKIENSEGVLMVPIADQEAFLGLLKGRVGLEIKSEDGLYSTQAPGGAGTVFFRFANKYAYATLLNKSFIDEKKLAKPEDVDAKLASSVLSISVRVDRIPDEMKKFALGSIETKLAEAKQQPLPNETETIKAVKEKAIDSLVGGLKSVLFDGKEITFKIDIDAKKDELALEIEMTAKNGSDLSKDFADFKTKKSVAFGSLSSSKSAMMMGMNISAPGSIKKVLGPAVDEVVKMLMGMAPGEVQEIVEPLAKALKPTLKTGDLDGGFTLQGPNADNLYTVVAVGKIANGKDVESAIKDIVQKVPEPFKSAFEIDADKEGDYKLHTLKVKDQLDEKAKKIFGESDLWLAFRDDAVLFAFGPDAKKALKEAIRKSPSTGSLFKLELSVTRLIALAEVQDAKAAKKASQDVFGKDPSGDTLTFSVEGGDKLSLRAALKGKVIKFGVAMDKAKKVN